MTNKSLEEQVQDLKILVAYSCVIHMGYSLIGMAAVVAAGEANGLNMKAAQAGLGGAVFQMFNHGTISAMLFILVGVIYERAHHRDCLLYTSPSTRDRG